MSSYIARIKSKAPKGVLIYLLGFYVLIQFCWWAYMLVDLNAEIYALKLELLQTSVFPPPEQSIHKGELNQKLSQRVWMVLGEGAVFIFILFLGFWVVRKSIVKELLFAEQQKNFLLSITHELKSPLAAIKLQLQTLQARKLDEDKKSLLYSRALTDTNRLEKLVENLLLVNKIESGRLPLVKTETDISAHVLELLSSHYTIELEKQRIELSIDSDVLSSIDKLALDSIIINLTDNSLKYGNGTKVLVEVESSGTGIFSILVSDKGEGIPNSEKEKVFDRFYRRGNEDVRKTKGTGIGLYLVKLLVLEHQGTISIQDNTPKGARFVVKIPTSA
jgi:signal transduction histidine kinase